MFHFQAEVSSGNWTFQCLSSCDVRVNLYPIIHTNELNLFCLFMWYQKLESFLNFLKSWNEFQKESNSKTVLRNLQNFLTAIFLFVTREKKVVNWMIDHPHLETANKFPKLYVTANLVGKMSSVMDYPPSTNPPSHTPKIKIQNKRREKRKN